jgi:hypothetical protein
VSNKGLAVPLAKLSDGMLFREEYSKGSMALFYVEDLELRGGFDINITESGFEYFISLT